MTFREQITLALLGALALGACGTETRREAATLADHVDRFRHAPNDDKPAAIAPLRAFHCSESTVCRAHEACLAYAEPTAAAIVSRQEIEQTLTALDGGRVSREDPQVLTLALKLENAEKLLADAQARRAACDEALVAMKRAARL